jgi:hypothetical protein
MFPGNWLGQAAGGWILFFYARCWRESGPARVPVKGQLPQSSPEQICLAVGETSPARLMSVGKALCAGILLDFLGGRLKPYGQVTVRER